MSNIEMLLEEIRDLEAENARLHKRLEDDHVWRMNAEKTGFVREDVEPGSVPDGIACRDETIKLLESRIDELESYIESLKAEK